MCQVAAIQMTSGSDVEKNCSTAQKLIQKAALMGARLIVLPEDFAMFGSDFSERLMVAETFGTGPLQNFLAQEALKHRIWLVGGTVPLFSNHPKKIRATTLVYSPKGECVAQYVKVHLFDATVGDHKKTYHESLYTEPGEEVVVVETDVGRVGIAICYDLRFPELFRKMQDQGVEIICLPAAFLATTGKAHWETLCRARAIENLSYFIGAGQAGHHEKGQQTFGESMVIDPWGSIVSHRAKGVGVVTAKIDLDYLKRVRSHFPVLTHRKLRG